MNHSPITQTPPKPSRPQNAWSPMDSTDPIDSMNSTDPIASTDQIDLGPIDFIPLGEGRAYTFGGKTIAVFRQRDEHLFATDNACPHKAGPLADGLLGSGKVICPLHMWKIDLETGQCLSEDGAVRTYPVRAANGRILVTLTSTLTP